jgi:hypothetical protein
MFGLLKRRQWSFCLSPLFRLYRLEESSPKSGRSMICAVCDNRAPRDPGDHVCVSLQ